MLFIKYFNKFPTNSVNAVSLECFGLNPCLANNILLVSKCFLTCMSTHFSKILDKTGNREIGVQLSLTDPLTKILKVLSSPLLFLLGVFLSG